MHKYSDLHKYQLKAIDWILQKKNCALWMDPGLGKTVCTLTAVKILKKEFEIHMPLVCAPLRVSKKVWPQEASKWEHLEGMTSARIYWPNAVENQEALYRISQESLAHDDDDTEDQRVAKLKRIDVITYEHYIPWLTKILNRKCDFYIINREQLHLLCRVLYLKWPFDMFIPDEASSFKNPSSLRFKGISAVRSKIDRMLELTGSPAANGLLNIWAQIWLLDKGESLHRTYTSYKDAFFVKGQDGYKYVVRSGTKEEIYQRIEHLCLTMLEEDYLELPPWNPIPVPLELPEKILNLYNHMEREFLITLDDKTVSASHKAALHNKLRQICNGAVYVDPEEFDDPEKAVLDERRKTKQWKEIHNVKIDALRSIVEEAEGQAVLVAYNFRHDLARLKKAFPQGRSFDDDNIEDEWNDGKIQLLFGHPASMGHGLNIQYGGHILVWFGFTWDLELFGQFNKRLHRQGQKYPVFGHLLYIDCKTETAMKLSLESKFKDQKEIMEYMKK